MAKVYFEHNKPENKPLEQYTVRFWGTNPETGYRTPMELAAYATSKSAHSDIEKALKQSISFKTLKGEIISIKFC